MESCQDKIQSASKLLHELLYKSILDSNLDLIDCTLKLTFRNGAVLYITYNDHSEYSYQIMYTKNKLDRERFDNYDKNWDVETTPNHFHLRGSTLVANSEMTGELDNDMPKLIEFVQAKLYL
ncbi:MAG: hypothetical protein HeimC2_05100 [Candidatus Heimdallarchaeota archaeon LC_2]|nr:MAG: hypothetical protein HeimC2_05100 [Candidatus Heimdallarchaeota archaeon LC_2]